MVGERPRGLSFLAILELALSIAQLSLGFLLFIIGNPLPGLFPNLNIGLAWLVFVGLGVVGLIIGFYMWSGQVFGWLVAVILAVTDLVLRILLPLMLGTSWIVFSVLVALDVVILY